MKKKVLVIAKTEPSPSKTHGASVCTAGITEEGEFIRLYPIPFRTFCDKNTRFDRYDWIEVECEKARDDSRKESYKVKGDVKVVGHINTDFNWAERNSIILPLKSKNFSDLESEGSSLGLIRPSEVLDFFRTNAAEAPLGDIAKEHRKTMQMMFEQGRDSVHMRPIPVIGDIEVYYRYKFKCKGEETSHEMMCEDWELYESARSWPDIYGTDDVVWEKIYEKFFRIFTNERDLHFFVGTHFRWGTWVIIGTYYPPITGPPNTRQTQLFNMSLML
ncbi:MAG: hypothetical protein LBG63_04940 [Candidatus Methanoplasma sp.]|jgi:hypothetical protein|nr:hypothetical protein [Candidatus Methanoplasma sp.]